MKFWIWILWLALLGLAWPYSQKAKHERNRPFEAYMIFVAVFSMVAGGVFLLISKLVGLSGNPHALTNPVVVIPVGCAMLVPGFLIARYLVRRPPRRQPAPRPPESEGSRETGR